MRFLFFFCTLATVVAFTSPLLGDDTLDANKLDAAVLDAGKLDAGALDAGALDTSEDNVGALGTNSPHSVGFNRDVRSILSKNCFACHGSDEEAREADLRLDTFEAAIAKRDDSAAIVPGKPAESEIWKRITSSDPDMVMPPTDSHPPLSDEEKSIIERWVTEGAKYEKHWSFIPPAKPKVPSIDGIANPIDAFIQRRLAKEELSPAPQASKETLIRRVTLDLTGLPPTLEEVDTFLADKSEDAYGRLVDRLQNRVTYGEHMARGWLDLARYADTHGLHLDNERSMWPYRDWVVRAMHENLPFDEFTRLQLAGDLLPEPTREQLIASGFNRCNVTTGEGGSIAEEWIFRYAVERTSATSEVWMGLTAGCAVCHDHKFDPLSTKEFYSLYAFFHSAADPAMDGNKIDTPPILKLTEPKHTNEINRLQAELDAVETNIALRAAKYEYREPTDKEALKDPKQSWAAWKAQNEAERNKVLSKKIKELVDSREPETWSKGEDSRVREDWLKAANVEFRKLTAELEAKKKKLNDEKTKVEKSIPITFIMADLKKPRDSFVMQRGAYDKPGEKVTRAVPSFLPALHEIDSEGADYNRLDLANWLLSPEHPLTSRVTVNRFWQQFFGTGLVETAEDFGTQGQLPSHPELLDWLAVQFIEDGWDMKQLVRRIVTSHAYRQESKVSPELLKADPQNRLFARGPRARLDAEVLRDQALFVSGLLVSKVGGVGVKPYQPPNIWEPVAFGGSNTRNYKQGSGDDLYRRSIYTFFKRTAPPPFMSTFDAPNREQACSRRGRSNTPMQALQLMNDVQHVEAARAFAQRMIKEGGESDADRILWSWRSVTGRTPDENELAVANDALHQYLEDYKKDANAAEELISFGESKPDADMDKAELAAYTMLANLLFNLDETVNKN